MASNNSEVPPSPSKLDLIRRFLRATGLQSEIDTGSFLRRYALGELFVDVKLREALKALGAAYLKHRDTWQAEYEDHVHWEFSEAELVQIVTFLESGAGQHLLEGRLRIDAYIGTNTEDLIEEIVMEAVKALRLR
jgi:hypothetical protein